MDYSDELRNIPFDGCCFDALCGSLLDADREFKALVKKGCYKIAPDYDDRDEKTQEKILGCAVEDVGIHVWRRSGSDLQELLTRRFLLSRIAEGGSAKIESLFRFEQRFSEEAQERRKELEAKLLHEQEDERADQEQEAESELLFLD